MVHLDQTKLFSHLPENDLKALSEVAEERFFPAGSSIFELGDPGDGVYLVKDGVVQISGMLTTGARQIFSTVTAGDFFGEMTVLDDLPRSASAEAECDTTVYFIPREQMSAMLHNSPDLAINMIQETSRRLREFNQQYMKTVIRAERMAVIGRFASSIVHDLKNPLAIIRMSAELACLDDVTTDMRNNTQKRITRQVDRINHLINDILEFTRGSQTSQILSRLDYAGFLLPLIQEIKHDVFQDTAQLIFENSPPETKIPLNPKRISRVFHNLIGNALDAMRGHGTITLSFEETDGAIVTHISDTGPGIPNEVLENIFDAFVTHGKEHGTGLGLSICQRIVQEHQGTITAQNGPDGGAVFSIILPKS